MFAELEGILLDPCYSAKGAAGLIDLARKGSSRGERIVFLHTGGNAALGGYDFAFDNADRWVTLRCPARSASSAAWAPRRRSCCSRS